MDGFKKRLNASIQLKLSFSLSLTILVVAIVAGMLSFVSAFDEAHELQDDTLTQVAALFDHHQLPLPGPGDNWQAKVSDPESRVIVQYLVDAPQRADKADVGGTLPIPSALADGFNTLELGGETFRILVKTTVGGKRIAVGQETGVRDEIARDSAFRTLLPFLVLVPILILLVADLVRKMFRPIALLSAEIDQRAEQELHPVVEDNLPVEVRPFVVAINRLLARVTQSMDAQRRFVADAAHELRSPLTAISLQAQRLAEAEMSEVARERLATLQRGIERGRNLLDQLLTLAQVQATPERPKLPISAQEIYRCVLEDLMPLAEAKRIDIGVGGAQDAQVLVSKLDMIIVIKNLVDNAIRYTPEGGRVDLSATTVNGRAVLSIQDNGPGILLAEHERVFDPFYRTLGNDQVGSGLGMSIVKTISDRIGAEIQLEFSDKAESTGLCISILIPLADENHQSPV
jgi:two-component system OmpR family sensor kinase